MLLAQNANIEAINKKGYTSLHIAASKMDQVLTKLFISNEANTTDLFNIILFHPEMVLQDKVNMLRFLFRLGISAETDLYTIDLDDRNIAQELKDIVNDLFLVEQIKMQAKNKLPTATNACQDLISERLEILLKQEDLALDYTSYKEYIENIEESKLYPEIKQTIIKFITKHQENISIFATNLLRDCFNGKIFPVEAPITRGEESRDFYLSIAEDLGIIEIKDLFVKKDLNQTSQLDLQKIIDNFNVQVINKYFGHYITWYGINTNCKAIIDLVLPSHIKKNITTWVKEYNKINVNRITCTCREDTNTRLQEQQEKNRKTSASNRKP